MTLIPEDWSTSDKLAAGAMFIAFLILIFTVVAGYFVPEVRGVLGPWK